MSIKKKITTGFVIQTWDDDGLRWTNQEFIAGDQVDYETEDGSPTDCPQNEDGNEPYLPFDMVQPTHAPSPPSNQIPAP